MSKAIIRQRNGTVKATGRLLRTCFSSFSAWIFSAFAWQLPALAQEATQKAPFGSSFTYVIVGGVAFAMVIALATVRSALMNSSWSLADALSEEADISPLDKDGKPIPGPDGKPQIVSELRASTSRVIALIGLIGILMLYLGFGLVILADFSISGTMPSDNQLKEVVYILLAGLTMFAPYIANKFSSVFDWLKPTK